MVELWALVRPLIEMVAVTFVAGGWLLTPSGGVARFGTATRCLGGALLLAAVLGNLAAAGVPAETVGAARWALLLGSLPYAWWRRPRHVDGLTLHGMHAGSLCVLVLLALVLAVPLLLALGAPPVRYDAVAIWWPKLREVAAGLAPTLENTTGHLHAEYPRGLAWMVVGALPFSAVPDGFPGVADGRMLRLASWFLAWVTAGAVYEAARRHDNRAGGPLAALLLAALPAYALWSHSGYADLAIAGAVLLCGLGLSLRREGLGGRGLAVVAALGAASIKQEGAVLVLVVGALLLLDVARCKDVRAASVAGLLSFAALFPWYARRGGEDAEVLGSWADIVFDPYRLSERITAVADAVWLFLTDRGALVDGAFDPPFFWAGWALLAGLLVLLPGGRRVIDARPALALLAAVLAVYVVTPFDLHWHLRTAFPRLLLQALPLVLLAAVHRVTAPPARVEPPPGRA